MTEQKLTDRQQRMYRALTDAWEVAYDIAQRAEIQQRTSGAVLNSLMQKGLVERKCINRDRGPWVDKKYVWRRVDR